MRRNSALMAAWLPAILATAEPASAEPAAGSELSVTAAEPAAGDPPRRHARATLELLGVTGIGTVWYWINTDLNQVDWELTWDWPSWRRKLFTFDALRLDTNAYEFNSINHPFAGTLFYQIGRANGFGPAGALVADIAATLFWEYVVEFKELISINDLFVNTSTGLAIGEPFVQMGRYFHQHGEGWDARLLALLFSPFDALHGWEAYRPRPGPAPWRRFRFDAGLRGAALDEGSRGEVLLGMDLELITQAGYDRPGGGARGVSAGAWNRIVARVALSQGASGTPFVGALVTTRTILVGHYRRNFNSAGDGWGLLAGVGTAFHYETRRLDEELDRLAIAHLAGPQFELSARRGPLALHWQLAAYGDFTLAQAHALAIYPLDPIPPFPSPMREHGYYFGFGATAETRLVLELDRWDLDLELRGHHIASIDFWKRTDDGLEDPEDIVDQRIGARAALGLDLGDGVGIAAVVEGIGRRGTWQSIDRRTLELSGGLHLLVFR